MNESNLKFFPPGVFVQEELRARGWCEADLQLILGWSHEAVRGLLTGSAELTVMNTVELATVFGTSVQLWVGLEVSYRLSLRPAVESGIRQRLEAMTVRSL